MASVALLAPKILKFEGGYVNDIIDPGGATNMGVTLATWTHFGHDKDGDGKITANDIKLLTRDDFQYVLKVGYWDRWHADNILNQSVAEILVDWLWGSGTYGITIPQRVLGIPQDGVVGINTLSVLNAQDQHILFANIQQARLKFVDDIIAVDIKKVSTKLGRVLSPQDQMKLTTKRFELGWKNRILGYTFA